MPKPHKSPNVDECASMIKPKILEKRNLRKRWQNARSPQDKAKVNKAVNELKPIVHDQKQKAIQTYFESLTATVATEYSLWKATKRLQRPQTPIPPTKNRRGRMGKK